MSTTLCLSGLSIVRGTFYRLDIVPSTIGFTTSPFPETESNEHTLRQILEMVKSIKGE